MRDDFPKWTITEIAKGVGYRCSSPECRRATVAANAAQDGTIIIGVAAHICAASSGGPRYNAAQTPQVRRSKENGIWLCQSCGRLVDADPNKFTVELLEKWKRDAQARAFRDLLAPGAALAKEPARVEAAVAADDARDADGAFNARFQRVRNAAAADLAAYKRRSTWAGGSVELTLRIDDDMETPSFSVSKLPLAIEVAPEVTIVAPPGTGKTTTLLQLGGHVLDADAIVPLYFRLGDWSAGSTGLLASLSQRPAFVSISGDDMVALAERGRLLLLLDGWNELHPDSRERLRVEIGQIRRNWPNVRIMVTTRQQMLNVPISGPRVEIEPLSEDQEMAIAEAGYGAAGAKIVDEAWRTSGLRELVATPLYLSALLAGGSRDAIPRTKEGVLRLFVQQHEQAGDHAAALQSALRGCHTEVLTELASHLNATGSTTMPEVDARRIVAAADLKLREQGQIKGALEPLEVLEALVSHHTLMRSGSGIAFQHQQFQEWYASKEVAALMESSAKDDTGARIRLRAAVLDQPAWEESVLFATERLSREDGGAETVAHAVRLALPTDPMLAAEMIYRASPAVWEPVKADVITFVERWHTPGMVDRAVRFMIMTGRPEFAPLIWPLASSSDREMQFATLRRAPRFRPRVLGGHLAANVATLPETTRENLLGLIAGESGVDGMDIAVELAKVDPSPKVQAEVAQSLQFRQADRQVADLMSAAHDETWTWLAEHGYAGEIRDPSTARRLHAYWQKAFERATDPSQRLHLLLEQQGICPGRDAAIAAANADPRFPINDHQGGSLYLAQRLRPEAVLDGLRQRLEAGLELPFHTDDLLEMLEVTDDGPIAQAILDTGRENRDLIAAGVIAGPKTVAALIDKNLACAQALQADRNNRAFGDEYHRIQSRIASTRAALFAGAVLARGNTDDPTIISSLAFLVSQHGADEDRKQPLAIDRATKPTWIALLKRWVDALIGHPKSAPYESLYLTGAIGRLGFRESIPDIKRLIDAMLARDDRRLPIDLSFFGNEYQSALIQIGGREAASLAITYLTNRSFSISAALVLKAISDKQLNVPESGFGRRWPFFDGVAAARASRAESPRPPALNDLADPIFAAVERLAKPDAERDDQLLAIGLARIGLGMPHADRDTLIARVLALPQPLKTKQTLLAAMVLDGFVIEADLVMQAIDEWLADASDPRRAWEKRRHTWEIEPWLELLPFTTRPDATLEGLTKVKAFYGARWAKQWERTLFATAAVTGKQGDDLLTVLARTHKDIAHDHTWMHAVFGRGTLEAVLLYVDLIIEGVFGAGQGGVNAWHVGRQLAEYVEKFPTLNDELKKRYEASTVGPGRAMLEHFFGEAANEDGLIAMLEKYAANGRTYDGHMARAVEAVTLDHAPIADNSNAYNIHPAPVANLRKRLFALLSGSVQKAALANECLTAIDSLRDEYGTAAGDTRHPDVMSDRPWPLEAAP